MKINKLLLLFTFALALMVRTYQLGKYPAGLNPDEASYGYNAYSLLKTGKDEWGTPFYKLFFTNLRSFGDYRFPLYAFLSVPSIAILGLTEFSTRLPNALVGSIGVLAIFAMTYRLFGNIRAAHLSALFLAVLPWHISLSRGAFETNALTTLIPLGAALMGSKKYHLSALIFAITTYSYLAARILAYPAFLIFAWFFKPTRSQLAKMVAVLVLISLPGLTSLVGKGNSRASDVGITSPTGGWVEVSNLRFTARNNGLPDQISRVFYNKATYLASLFTKSYLSYFSPQFLFTSGASESNYGIMSGTRLLYFFQFPLLIVFLFTLVKYPSRGKWAIIVLALISPIPAALSKGPGYAANRSAILLIWLTIMSAVGAVYTLRLLDIRKGFIILTLFTAPSFMFFAADYWFRSPQIFGPAMNYGWKELIYRLGPLSQNFSEVKISRSLSEPHIFLAFYDRTDPQIYQKASQDWIGFEQKYKFLDQFDGYYLGKYRFGDLHINDSVNNAVLLVGRPEDFPDSYPEYFHIDYPTGKVAIKVAEKRP